jgi:maltodextrin utilization protein YvdJ
MTLWQLVLLTLISLLLTTIAAHFAGALSFGLGTMAITHASASLIEAVRPVVAGVLS